jgi:hypothetical protein
MQMRPRYTLTDADINRLHHLDDAKQKVDKFGKAAWLHKRDLISYFVFSLFRV